MPEGQTSPGSAGHSHWPTFDTPHGGGARPGPLVSQRPKSGEPAAPPARPPAGRRVMHEHHRQRIGRHSWAGARAGPWCGWSCSRCWPWPPRWRLLRPSGSAQSVANRAGGRAREARRGSWWSPAVTCRSQLGTIRGSTRAESGMNRAVPGRNETTPQGRRSAPGSRLWSHPPRLQPLARTAGRFLKTLLACSPPAQSCPGRLSPPSCPPRTAHQETINDINKTHKTR